MKRCPICNEWHTNDTDICPECGTELERNEVSSEDGDDGYATKNKADNANADGVR